jgi:hypothetical protein
MLRVGGIRRKRLSQTSDTHGNPVTGQNASAVSGSSCILHGTLLRIFFQVIDLIGFLLGFVTGTGDAPYWGEVQHHSHGAAQ